MLLMSERPNLNGTINSRGFQFDLEKSLDDEVTHKFPAIQI